MRHYTYLHKQADDGSVFYVGKGVMKRAWDCKQRSKKWKSIVEKHGHTVEICAHWNTAEEAFDHEKFLIFCFKDIGLRLANLTDGGDGPNGYKYSDEQKIQMGLRRKGRKHSDETRMKISLSQKGIKRQPISDEAKAKMSASRKGKKRGPISEETRKKLSDASSSSRPEVRKKISDTLKGRTQSVEIRMKKSLKQSGVPKTAEHIEKIRTSRLAYFERQRQLTGKSMTISDEHKKALRQGYNKKFGIKDEIN